MTTELFSISEVTMDSPRLAWMKRHDLQCWHTPLNGRCECPETGEEIKEWTCCTLAELDRMDTRAVGTGDTAEEACIEWARTHHEPLWNQEPSAAPSNNKISGDRREERTDDER